LRRVNTAAAKTSFHDSTQVKMAAAVSPGRASGSDTRRKARAGEQPNVCAASSSSRGMETKTELVMSTAKGKASAVCMKATPQTVSKMPKLRYMTASGMERMTMGKARVERTTSR
jgi:hypothetical protein